MRDGCDDEKDSGGRRDRRRDDEGGRDYEGRERGRERSRGGLECEGEGGREGRDYSRRDSGDYGRRSLDKDLSGSCLKLVRYKVLFVKRDYETAFPEREELVADDLSATDFTAWKIAEFIQRLDEEEVPRGWREKGYPREYGGERTPKLGHLPEGDKKYLRVYYEVLARYDREEFHHEEREVEVLEGIRDEIRRLNRE